MRSHVIATTLAIAMCVMASRASADTITYGFNNVTTNNVNDVATGEAQLFVDVSNDGVGANQVKFVFRNTGPNASSITAAYFDDGSLLGIASITDSGAGVAFSQGASPPDLPGGNGINFNTTAGFLADSDPPTQPNGVNPGESLTILFNLVGGKTYADTIAALNLSLANPGVDVNGGLRIGVHVQGFTGGGSESFVNGPPGEPIPLPAAVWGGMALCSFIGGAKIRARARRQAQD